MEKNKNTNSNSNYNKNNSSKKKYTICKDKKDGVSGCRDCCKRYFIEYNDYTKCVNICMNN